MPLQIISYELDWNTSTNTGAIRIMLAGANSPTILQLGSAEAWIATALILGKAPAYFVPPNGVISTGVRQVGT